MKKTGLFQFVIILIGASLLVACGQAAVPNAILSAPVGAPLTTAIPQANGVNTVSPKTGNCTLLSQDEASQALGETVIEVRDPSKKGLICVYQTQNLILELNTIHTFGGYVDSVKYMQATRGNNIGETPVDVPGLGDEAFYHGASAYRILLVRKGDTVYSIGVRNVTADQSLSSPENAQAMEKAIAELFLGHLS